MAEVSITIPDQHLTRVLNAYAKSKGYKETIRGEANPETKAQFMKRTVIMELKLDVRNGELQLQREAADAISDIDIT